MTTVAQRRKRIGWGIGAAFAGAIVGMVIGWIVALQLEGERDAAFEKVDAIVCPTTPEPAFKAGDRTDDPLKMYLADIFTIACNLAGTCGVSIPCGFANTDGKKLPIGLQLIGQPFKEAQLLQIAHAYEQSTDWSKARPGI